MILGRGFVPGHLIHAIDVWGYNFIRINPFGDLVRDPTILLCRASYITSINHKFFVETYKLRYL